MTADDLPEAFNRIPPCWREVLPDYTPALRDHIAGSVRRVSGRDPIGPEDPFRALRLVAPEAVKVVVLGQDPYPTIGHADGLAFSAGRGKPRSLARIFEVLAHDRPGFKPPSAWRLDDWAIRGVLLLNPTLTVELGKAGSHLQCGWQIFTAQIVAALCRRESPPTFLLWGSRAGAFFQQAKPPRSTALVLTTRHPSYDFKRHFMAEGSHFIATQHLVDWWAIGPAEAAN